MAEKTNMHENLTRGRIFRQETGLNTGRCTRQETDQRVNQDVHQNAAHATHENGELRHHHSHAATSAHPGHHHLLTVEDLSVSFRMYGEDAPFFAAKQREVPVIDNLSISVHEGEIVAVVGASGSGKTLLADAIMGLFEPNALVTGRVWFDGDQLDAAGLAALRGRGISLVPQSVRYLDPLMKVGRQAEGFAKGRVRCDAGARSQRNADVCVRREKLFARYGLGPEVADMYPFQLSGGMARRVLLCCALMDDPRLIVADEPTPGLDLPLAVRAMNDFRAFADDGGGVLLITHDIELALRVADRIAVFRDGTVVEETAVANFASPELLRTEFARELWHALPEHGFVAPEASAAPSDASVPDTHGTSDSPDAPDASDTPNVLADPGEPDERYVPASGSEGVA